MKRSSEAAGLSTAGPAVHSASESRGEEAGEQLIPVFGSMRFGDDDIHKHEGPALQRELRKYGISMFVVAPQPGDDINKVVFDTLKKCRAFIAFGTCTYGEDTGNTACTYNELSFWQNALQKQDPTKKLIPIRMLRDGEDFDTEREGVVLAQLLFGKNLAYEEWKLGSTRQTDPSTGAVHTSVPEKIVRKIVRTINPQALHNRETSTLKGMDVDQLRAEVAQLLDHKDKLEAEHARDQMAMSKLGLGKLMEGLQSEEANNTPVRAVVLGAINLDIAASTGMEWPDHDASGVGVMKQGAGGKGANESVALAKLGVHPALVGCIGRDNFGELLRLTLSKQGVDTSGVRAAGDVGQATGSAVQIIAKGGAPVKFSVMCPNANDMVGEEEVRVCNELLNLPDVDVLLLQNEVHGDVMAKAIAHAKGLEQVAKTDAAAKAEEPITPTTKQSFKRRSNVAVAFKASPLPRDGVQNVDRLVHGGVDIIFLNEWEALTLLGGEGHLIVTLEHLERAADALLARWPTLKAVVITCAVANLVKQRVGTPWLAGRPASEQHALSVVGRVKGKTVDVIGAADAFVGAFIASALAEKPASASPFTCLLRASLAGDFSTQKAGAQDSLPTVSELAEYSAKRCPRLSAMEYRSGVHVGVTCDRSGACPIEGNRYQLSSHTGHEINLCEAEFEKLSPKERLLYQQIAPPPPPAAEGSALHMAVLRADPAVLRAMLKKPRSELRTLLAARDVFDLTPSQRAYQCFLLEPKKSSIFPCVLRDVLLAQLLVEPTLLLEGDLDDATHEVGAIANESVFPTLALPASDTSRVESLRRWLQGGEGNGKNGNGNGSGARGAAFSAASVAAVEQLVSLVKQDAIANGPPGDAEWLRALAAVGE